MKLMLGLILFLSSSLAMASEELTNIIQCHEALDGKSDGLTQKLGFDSATPIALASKKIIYFVTDTSIYSLENKFLGKALLIHLRDKDKDFYRQMEIRKDGDIGTISYDEVKDTKTAIEAKPSLDVDSLSLIQKDLLRRVTSMNGEYQNKFDPQDTLNALKICADTKSPEMQKAIAKQTAYYEGLLKKPKAYSQGLKKNSGRGKK